MRSEERGVEAGEVRRNCVAIGSTGRAADVTFTSTGW